MSTSIIEKLTARNPIAVLRDLNKERAQCAVTLSTYDGFSVSGKVLSIEREGSEEYVLIHVHDSSFRPDDRVCYLHTGRISAVAVSNPALVAKILSPGSVARNVGQAPVTRFQLKRDLTQQAQALSIELGLTILFEVDWANAPASADVDLNIKDLFQAFCSAQKEFCIDSIGKDAVSKISKWHLVHKANAEFDARAEAGVVTLSLDLTRALPNDLTSVTKNIINKVF